MTTKALLFFAAGMALTSCVARGLSPSDQVVSIGTHCLQIHREGKGFPTVIIDSGIGDHLDKLRPLQERIAKVTQVCTYNRAGYGQSDPGPLPRHSGREAEELKALLDSAHVSKPYVLVGHSLGALNVQVYAARYPADVAGIILLDPPPLSFLLGEDYTGLIPLAEQMTAQWEAIADSASKSADARARTQAAFFRMIASEHREMFGESARLAAAIKTFGEVPLLVIAAGKPNPFFRDVADDYQRYWIEQCHKLSLKSSNGRFILAEQSSHYLYLDAPDLVVEGIRSVVSAVRGE